MVTGGQPAVALSQARASWRRWNANWPRRPGGRLLSYTPFAVLRCHSRAAGPYRPHEPHPDYDCLYGHGEVELVGPPRLHDGPERTVAVEVMPPDQAVSFLTGKGRAWEADLYRLAAERHAAAT
jgi:hypothetical protein